MTVRAQTFAAVLALTLAATTGAASTAVARPADGAPGGPGAKATWAEADKTGFGTSRSRRSNVWFTLQDGRASEVFYPDLSTPSVRSLELVVTDGSTFTDRESRDTVHETSRPDEASLGFTQVNTAKSGKYRITKRFVTDPRRDALRIKVRFTSLDGGRYRVYVLHDPALDNSGMDDRARTVGKDLVAWDGNDVASALVARPGFGGTSNGYLRRSDGWVDLATDHHLDDRFDSAGPGNVVQTGRLAGVDGTPGRQRAALSLGFGRTWRTARATAHEAARDAFSTTRARYDAGWHRYLASLRDVPASAASVRRQYLASTLVPPRSISARWWTRASWIWSATASRRLMTRPCCRAFP